MYFKNLKQEIAAFLIFKSHKIITILNELIDRYSDVTNSKS